MRPVEQEETRRRCGVSASVFDALRRAAWATGTAVYQGFRTASRTAPDTPHRHAIRSLPKTLVYRPYGSLLLLFGITPINPHVLYSALPDVVKIAKFRQLQIGNASKHPLYYAKMCALAVFAWIYGCIRITIRHSPLPTDRITYSK